MPAHVGRAGHTNLAPVAQAILDLLDGVDGRGVYLRVLVEHPAGLGRVQGDLGHGALERLAVRRVHDLPAPERFVLSRFAVDRDTDLDLATVLFARRRSEGGLDRLENDLFIDTLFVGHCVHYEQDFFVHRFAFRLKLWYQPRRRYTRHRQSHRLSIHL